MTDKLQGGVLAGSTSVSWSCALRKTSDSTEHTGRAAADVTLSYWRQGGERVGVSASTLVSASSSWSVGGWKEVDSTNMPGLYRMDFPDAAFAAGADFVHIAVKSSGTFVFHERVPLTTNIIQSGDNFPVVVAASANIAAVKTVTDQMVFSTANRLNVQVFGLQNGTINANVIASNAIDADALAADALAEIKTQTVEALSVDTYGEPTGAPAATTTIVDKIGRVYQVLRNQVAVSAGSKIFYNDAGTALWSKTLSDDGSVYTEAEGS